MQQAGFRVIPVNPNIESALGERAYPSLRAVPDPIDLIDVFRRPCYVADLVAPAIASGARAFWMQLGVRDDASAQALERAGLTVVSDRCLMLEYGRLLG
jgi:predicted CoA-binding protein